MNSLSTHMLGVDVAILLCQLRVYGASFEVRQPLPVRLTARAEALFFEL